MSGRKELKKGNRLEAVTKEVNTTRKEIDELKAELDKLINNGLESCTNKENVFENQSPCKEQGLKNELNTQPSNCKRLSRCDLVPTITTTRSQSKSSTRTKPAETEIGKASPTRNKRYDQEEVRKYMNKQKEMRSRQAKEQKESKVSASLVKKQKLMELQKEQLNIVRKNVERKRSKSREPAAQTDLKSGSGRIPDLIITSVEVKRDQRVVNHHNPKSSQLKTHPELKNITFRKTSPQPSGSCSRNQESQNVLLISPRTLHNSATKIQATYKGYLQRKQYKMALAQKRSIQVKTPSKLPKESNVEVETQTDFIAQKLQPDLPNFLRPHPASNPYNFINTVKRKLNLPINSPRATTDAPVQSSLKEKTPVSRSRSDMKEQVAKTSDQQVNVIPKAKSNSSVQSEISKHSNAIHSDSDTSKNIPTITSEGSGNSSPKQKGEEHLKSNRLVSNSVDTENPTDSDYSEYKLKINTEYLKSLHLQRRKIGRRENRLNQMSSSSDNRNTKIIATPKNNPKQQISTARLSEIPHRGSVLKNIFILERDSIICGNKSNYSEIKSPRNSPINTMETPTATEKVTQKNKFAHTNISSKLSPSHNVHSVNTKSSSSVIETHIESSSKAHEPSTVVDKKSKSPSNVMVKESKTISSALPIKSDNSASSHRTRSIHTQLFDPTVKDLPSEITSQKSASQATKHSSDMPSSINTEKRSSSDQVYSDNFSVCDSGASLSLKRPSFALETPRKLHNDDDVDKGTLVKNNSETTIDMSKPKSNEIHLKIEAELHFLNDFNDSLRSFIALEKSILENKAKSNNTLLKNKDTQTSIVSKSCSADKVEDDSKVCTERQVSGINYSRGSSISECPSFVSLITTDIDNEAQIPTNSLEISKINDSVESSVDESNMEQSVVTNDGSVGVPYVNLWIDQLIKEEDSRIKNLTTILKIQEKTLLDRCKVELLWLEVQKKQLKETGRLHEASLLKRKQRGIVMRLQHERNEMQRVKQMQKTASKERKAELRQKRSMIKAQLSTESMLAKVKVNTPRENSRSSGPFKVYNIQSHSESIQTETSVSRKVAGEEIINVSSHTHSIISCFSNPEPEEKCADVQNADNMEKIKKTLLMREAVLQKRRKAAEDLVQWYQRLMEEEKRVVEIEMVANSILTETPKLASHDADEQAINGSQLNTLWKNMPGRQDKKFNDHETYTLSQIGLEHLCKDVKKYTSKHSKCSDRDSSYDSINTDIEYHSDVNSAIKSDSVNKQFSVISEHRPKGSMIITDTNSQQKQTSNYSSDFEIPTSLNNRDVSTARNERTSSISELIDNLTKSHEEKSLIKTAGNEELQSKVSIKPETTSTNSGIEKDELQSKTLNKPETNKLLHLHTDNSRAILDSIENLKSSIQKITSQSDSRYRNSRYIERASECVTVPESNCSATDVSLSELSTDKTTKCVEIKNLEADQGLKEQNVTICSDDSKKLSIQTSADVTIAEELKDTADKSVLSHINEENLDNLASTKSLPEETNVPSEETSELSAEKEFSIKSDVESENNSQGSKTITEHASVEEMSNKDSNKIASEESPEINSIPEVHEESDAKKTLETIIPTDDTSEIQTAESQLSTSKSRQSTLPNLSYGLIIPNEEPNPVSSEDRSDQFSSKIDTEASDERKNEEHSEKTEGNSTGQIDVKKRVLEILADTGSPRGDRSPRVQDLYVTTYDVFVPENSSEPKPFVNCEKPIIPPSKQTWTEAEELRKKQLAIEQEIKQLEQQQKEQLPYLFVREIPNKPPPPYTPPVSAPVPTVSSIIPTNVEHIDIVTAPLATILHEAFLKKYLDSVSLEENESLFTACKPINKQSITFLFDVCKELAIDHYSQFKQETGPLWMHLGKKKKLSLDRPFDEDKLREYLSKKLKQLFGFEKVEHRESAIIKWSRKKRDHVDEILVLEAQAEEPEWTNYDKDELLVKNELTSDILNLLIKESAEVMSKALEKKTKLQ